MKLLLPILILFLSGCSTAYKNTLRNTAIAGVGGAIYGASRSEYKEQNAALFGASAALIAIGASLLFDVDENNQAKSENEKLRQKLSSFEASMKPHLVSQGSSLFQSPIPKDMAHLVQPGEWKRFRLDQWVQDSSDPNTFYRQTEMFQVIPPTPN